MNLTTYTEFDQNTDLWLLARLGLPTSSCFKIIMSRGVGKAESVRRGVYIEKLVAELMWSDPCAKYEYQNKHMDRGHEWEPDALAAYIEEIDEPVEKVGFVRNNELNVGCSPDALVGKDGGVEIKTLAPWLMVRYLRAPGMPAEHEAQLQGCMLVTGRQWWDLVLYTRGHIERIRVGRDEGWISEFKTSFLAPFQAELERATLEATKGRDTWRALRALRDRQFSERLAEELEEPLSEINLAKVAADLSTPPVSAIAAALAASLEREKFMEDDSE